ncbi:unnamed protein product [Symbiodinium natans]|uniref:Uncharacterized protein n=1 Tax=Symbiodinium natans TaxID=878477 RepID=A0A812M6A7_9DINO|nr:unnamed protein product [Symbiodinium natans]
MLLGKHVGERRRFIGPSSLASLRPRNEVGSSISAWHIVLKDPEPGTAVCDALARHDSLSKRFAALSKRATLVALAPGTGKSTLTVLLNEALARKVDPMQFVELHIGRLPKSVHYTALALREALGFKAPVCEYFADSDVVLESLDPRWRPRAEKLMAIAETSGRMPPGAYEELILDFWEQVDPAELPQVLLMNNYGCEEAPWFTLRAKLPLKEMESRWRGRISSELSDAEAEKATRSCRFGWHDMIGEVLEFPEIVQALVCLATTPTAFRLGLPQEPQEPQPGGLSAQALFATMSNTTVSTLLSARVVETAQGCALGALAFLPA